MSCVATAAQLFQLGAQGGRLFHGLPDVAQFLVRLLDLLLNFLERGTFTLDRLDHALNFRRGVRDALDVAAMLFEIAVGRNQSLGLRLRLADRGIEQLRALFHVAQRGGLSLDVVQALGDRFQGFGGGAGFLANVFERLARLGELAAAHRDLGQHRAQRAPLFAGRGDQRFKLFGLLLRSLTAAGKTLQCIQHSCPQEQMSEWDENNVREHLNSSEDCSYEHI